MDDSTELFFGIFLDRKDRDEWTRQILEAAAPHMLAGAWEEGYGLGYSDMMWSKGHEPRARNPYRPTP